MSQFERICAFFFGPLRALFAYFSRSMNTVSSPKHTVHTPFTRHFADETEGWQFESTDNPVSFSVGNIDIKPLFRAPHPNTQTIQRGVATSMFSRVGGSYLPRRLHALLREMDAFQAVRFFLTRLGLKYETLLRSSEDRTLLDRYLRILIHADVICQESKLSDLPVYDALAKRDLALGEMLIERLHQAQKICRGIDDAKIVFPAYQADFVIPAKEKVALWETLDESTLNELGEILNIWISLQETYNDLNLRISRLIADIGDCPLGEENLKNAFHTIVGNVDTLFRDIESGKIIPSEGIEVLQEYYEELETIFETVHEEAEHTSTGKDHDRTEGDHLQRFLEILGLKGAGAISMDELKKTFRNLLKTHHPDANGGSFEATEKTRRIIEAYTFLHDHLGRGANLYG